MSCHMTAWWRGIKRSNKMHDSDPLGEGLIKTIMEFIPYHIYINFHFENLEYDDTYFTGDFYPDDNNGHLSCSFIYDRIKETFQISNNEVPEEEILPLPMGYLEWKLMMEGKLDKTVWKVSM